MCTLFYSPHVALTERLVRGERSENSNISRGGATGAQKRPLFMNYGNQKLGMHWTAEPPIIAGKAKRLHPGHVDGGLNRTTETPERVAISQALEACQMNFLSKLY